MNHRVLVVDDDPGVRSALARLLRQQDYEVVTAADGEAALRAFESYQPDLVFLDVVMPKLDGFEVCRRLKIDSNTRLTPVVLVTGLDAVSDRVRGLDAGADDFLSKPVDRLELTARARSLLAAKRYTDELDRAESVVLALARSIEARDPYTEGHCERLSRYATGLGARLGMSDEYLNALRRGGIAHDLGKVGVPDAVLLKRSRLTEEEWSLMRQHPVTGERICQGLKSFRLVLPLIRHHHEKLDGSGYPDGLAGEEIPLHVRVLQVVDVYDALTTERPYKAAQSPGTALRMLEEEVRKGWWDGEVVAEFSRLIAQEADREADHPPKPGWYPPTGSPLRSPGPRGLIRKGARSHGPYTIR